MAEATEEVEPGDPPVPSPVFAVADDALRAQELVFKVRIKD
jgi:hypothetical protein